MAELLLKLLLQTVELLMKAAVPVIFVRLSRLPGEGKAPDGVALALLQRAEIAHKAFQQIGFGHHDVDRKVNAGLLVQLAQPIAHGARLSIARLGRFA